MIEHTVEPDLDSVYRSYPWSTDPLPEGEYIGMRRGKCNYCGREIDFDDDNAWHVEG
jgi:hypothetical protein